ncbi:hypothetical protein Tco_0712101 [Tanacetum coccineum]
MKEVVKKDVKLIDTCIIYPIVNSPSVSLTQCVPKKGGITIVTNEKDELIPTRTITGWRICIDYRKLNDATAKDPSPLPFMDQMLERLTGNEYFSLLLTGGRMPFGLCNALATFQRCMIAIFHEMIEESVKLFMDDFSVFGKCHFMVKEGIVLGHKVSAVGLEVDKAKIDVISKLPTPLM